MADIKEMMKAEAIKRMEKMKIAPEVIELFKEKEEVMVSVKELGMVHKLPLPDKFKKLIDEWQEDTGCVVYHAIYSNSEFGALLSVLYVSDCDEGWENEWEIDWEEINSGYPAAYVFNLTTPMFSEIGSIGIEEVNGGLVRTF